MDFPKIPRLREAMYVIGVTGGIGTGKTEVSKILECLGAEVINADLVGHEAYEPHTEGWREVVGAFGEEVLAAGGEVDRKKLGAIVFSDPGALKRLNAIMHPRIYGMIEERIETLGRNGWDVVVVEAALLLEANWTTLVSELWVTTSSDTRVVGRLQERNNLDEASIVARIRTQMPQEERVLHADAVIDNSGSLAELKDQVRQLWHARVPTAKEIDRKR